jgi:hypothetical protein
VGRDDTSRPDTGGRGAWESALRGSVGVIGGSRSTGADKPAGALKGGWEVQRAGVVLVTLTPDTAGRQGKVGAAATEKERWRRVFRYRWRLGREPSRPRGDGRITMENKMTTSVRPEDEENVLTR